MALIRFVVLGGTSDHETTSDCRLLSGQELEYSLQTPK